MLEPVGFRAGQLAPERAAGLVTERTAPLMALLNAAERALAAEIEVGLKVAGHGDLRAAHVQVFAAVHPDGSHLTNLAAHAGMTKQAMGELVRYLEQHGYLTVEPDLRDRRAKQIRLTDTGWRARDRCLGLIEAAEQRLVARFGQQSVEELRAQLLDIAEDAPR